MANSSRRTLPPAHIVPPTQNTAPVIEYRCLHTSDIRRKQKRWQDGRLKFHTFNKRVMVYDDRSNFVGDTHWCEDYEFGEGLEVELERSGILVQVSECMGKKDQDLSELWDKQQKDREEKTPSFTAVFSSPQSLGNTVRRQSCISPQPNVSQHRSMKRRRPNDSPPIAKGYAQNLMGATLTLSGKPPRTVAVRRDSSQRETCTHLIESSFSSESPLALALNSPVIQNTTNEQIYRKKVERKAIRPLMKQRSLGQAITLSGAAFRVNKKAMNRNSTKNDDNAYETCNNSLIKATIWEDDFVDIDVFNAKAAKCATVLNSSTHVRSGKGQEIVFAEMSQLLSHRAIVKSGGDDWSRHDKPLNSLRIKARPKSKLLLVDSSQPHLFAARKSLESRDVAGEDLSILCEKNLDIFPKGNDTNAIPPFKEQQQRRTQRASDQPFVALKRLSPGTGYLDYVKIDALFSSKTPGFGLLESRSSDLQAITELSDASAAIRDSRDGHPSRSLVRQTLDDRNTQYFPDLHAYPIREQENLQNIQKSTAEDNSIGNNDMVCIKVEASRKATNSGSIKEITGSKENSSSDGVYMSADDSKCLHLSTTTMRRKQRTALPKPQLPMINVYTSAEAHTQQGDLSTRASTPFLRQAQSIVTHTAFMSGTRISHLNRNSIGEDLGPWSQEAFDLFDWRPGPRTGTDQSAVA